MSVQTLDWFTDHSPAGNTAGMEDPSDVSDDQMMDEVAGSGVEAEPAVEEFEDDPKRLIARQKQIDFGKNTIGYENYLKAVPKERRRKFGPLHDPPTPDITKKYSKKTWDGIVKAWRRHLHKFDEMKPDEVATATTTPVQPSSGAATIPVQGGGSGPDVPADSGARSGQRWQRGKGLGRQQKRTPQQQHNIQQQQKTLETTPLLQEQQQLDSQTDNHADRAHQNSREELDYGASIGSSGRQRSPVRNSRSGQRDRQYDERSREARRYDRHDGHDRYDRQRESERPRYDSSRRSTGGRDYGSSSDRWRDSKGYSSSGVDRRKWEALGSRMSSRDDRGDRDRRARGYSEGSKQQQQRGEDEREGDVWQYPSRPAGRSWADEVEGAEADAAGGGGGYNLSDGEVDPRQGSSRSPPPEARRSSRHSRGQLTPAKRSSCQGMLDQRPMKALTSAIMTAGVGNRRD